MILEHVNAAGVTGRDADQVTSVISQAPRAPSAAVQGLLSRLYAAFKADEGAAFKADYRYRVEVEGLLSSVKTRFAGAARAL